MTEVVLGEHGPSPPPYHTANLRKDETAALTTTKYSVTLAAANSNPRSASQPLFVRSARQSPAPQPSVVTHRNQDASILLLGIRGTGKTSLALLAASSINFGLVDADQQFQQSTGMSRAAFLSRFGVDKYRRHELDMMRTLLEQNPTRCIIVCGPGSAEGAGQQLLLELGNSHPVIHIMRDAEDIARYLHSPDVAHVARLAELATSSYRAASNYEFYNLSEPQEDSEQSVSLGKKLPSHPSLALKRVEQDFLRLVHGIRFQSAPPRVLREARSIISFIPPESKHYTYALTLPMQAISEVAFRLRGTDLGVDAVEMVIELEELLPNVQLFSNATATRITKEYYTLRRNVGLPVVVHIALPDSLWGPATSNIHVLRIWSSYLQVVAHVLRLAPDYLTIDLRCESAAARSITAKKASTKIIGHFYDPLPQAGAWESRSRLALLDIAANWDCDLIRLCQYSNSRVDNAAVQSFLYRVSLLSSSSLPVIAYNVGHEGRQSCFNNSILTPVTHRLVDEASSLIASRCVRPLLTAQQAQSALFSSFALDKLVFGIFGSAVSSTLSPPMHNAAFAFCGMPHEYHIYQSSSLSDLGPIVQDPNFGGASISAPFKKEIFSVLDHVSPEAQAIGAVNTIIPLRSGGLDTLVDRNKAGPIVALFGDNTDWIGLYSCIRQNLSPVNAANSRKTALILGAGGMAQAAIYAAIRLGVETVFIHNRTPSRAEQLVNQFDGRAFPLPSVKAMIGPPNTSPLSRSGTATPNTEKMNPIRVHVISSMADPWPAGFESPTIVVSCIARVSVNGEPKADNTLPEAWLSSSTGGVAVELAYNPLETPLLKQVQALRSRGWIAVHGLEVLPEQAYAQFELFTGRPAPTQLMRAQIAEHLRASLQSKESD